MKYRVLIIFFNVILLSCGVDNKVDLVVYPEYCGGCVSRIFYTIKNDKVDDKFNIYFDTTDIFVLGAAKLNSLNFNHLENSNIRLKFGDYANVVLFSSGKEPIELKTNEIIEKGKHY